MPEPFLRPPDAAYPYPPPGKPTWYWDPETHQFREVGTGKPLKETATSSD